MLPFKEKIIEENENFILVQRNFMSMMSEEELNWHKDKEEREVFLVEGDGWYLQMENEIPVLMQKGSVFKIPKETWHRIINKNGTNLIINVRKYK
jgi:quercetin dioxygenase-like cupin family protein